jgi:hypothetical protein
MPRYVKGKKASGVQAWERGCMEMGIENTRTGKKNKQFKEMKSCVLHVLGKSCR